MTTIGNYLGFTINHRGVPRNRMNFIVEKVMGKLAGWLEGEVFILYG